MKLTPAQEKTYNGFKNKATAEQYKSQCLAINSRQKKKKPKANKIPKAKPTSKKQTITPSPKPQKIPVYPYSPSEETQQKWEAITRKLKVKEKCCFSLQPGELFKTPDTREAQWHRFIEFIPQDVLPGYLLIRSVLLPDEIEGQTYHLSNFKFFVSDTHHDLIIS